MPAPTYLASASNPADNGTGGEPTTLAVTPPANMRAGDLVVLLGIHRLAADTITLSATGNQLWNDTGNLNGTLGSVHLWWCEFNGTFSANPSLAFAAESGTIPVSAIMLVFHKGVGQGAVWKIDTAIAGGVEGSASTVVVTGITPAHDDNVTLAGWLVPNISTWGTLAGTGWNALETAQFRNSIGNDISATFAYNAQAAKATTNDVSQNPTTAAAGTSFIISWYALPVDTGYQVNHRR